MIAFGSAPPKKATRRVALDWPRTFPTLDPPSYQPCCLLDDSTLVLLPAWSHHPDLPHSARLVRHARFAPSWRHHLRHHLCPAPVLCIAALRGDGWPLLHFPLHRPDGYWKPYYVELDDGLRRRSQWSLPPCPLPPMSRYPPLPLHPATATTARALPHIPPSTTTAITLPPPPPPPLPRPTSTTSSTTNARSWSLLDSGGLGRADLGRIVIYTKILKKSQNKTELRPESHTMV